MARFEKGSPEARARARLAAAARWGRRAPDRTVEVAIAAPRGVQLDRMSSREFEGAIERQERLAALAKITARQNVNVNVQNEALPSSSSAAAPAGDSGSPEGVTPAPPGGGSQKFSSQEAVSPDKSATSAVPAVVQPAPAVRTGPAWRCGFCAKVVPAAAQGTHGRVCPGSLAMHESARWVAVGGVREFERFDRPAAAPAIALLKHFCGVTVAVADRASHRCPEGTPRHEGLTAEEWRAA